MVMGFVSNVFAFFKSNYYVWKCFENEYVWRLIDDPYYKLFSLNQRSCKREGYKILLKLLP